MNSRTLPVTCECGNNKTVMEHFGEVLSGVDKLKAMLTEFGFDVGASDTLSSIQTKDCTACNGTGYVVVPNGPEDVDKELCTVCEGRGRVVANDLEI